MEAKWYVVRTFSGHENKVKQFLETELQENEQLKSKIKDILVPTEKVFEVKDGKKKSKTQNFFPGYILVQAELDNQVKEFILRTQYSTANGRVGRSRTNPGFGRARLWKDQGAHPTHRLFDQFRRHQAIQYPGSYIYQQSGSRNGKSGHRFNR